MKTIRQYSTDVEDLIWKRFWYDGENLRYREPVKGKKEDDIAGTLDARGYRRVSVLGHKLLVHRIIWFICYGEWPEVIDHKNRNKQDNRLENLRECTYSQNLRNVKGNGLKGVRQKRSGRWEAYISKDRKFEYIGTYDTEREAAEAYDAVAWERFGEFACLNYPGTGLLFDYNTEVTQTVFYGR